MFTRNLTRAVPVLGAERAGPGVFEYPPLIRLLGHVATRSKRHSKERKKSLQNLRLFLGQVEGQVTRGHKRSNFAFSAFFYKSAHNSGTGRATAPL